MATGCITDIQRYSVHDGPGIRTTVFLKGCNMRCAWCHNPETLSAEPEYIIDPSKCIHCGRCAEGCFSGARRKVGRRFMPEEALAQVLPDKPYYGSEGGLTVSGGEPTLQAPFVEELLELAHKEGIHCAMESNLLAPQHVLESLLSRLDLLMCDLKLWDSEAHRKWTGADNEAIKRNMAMAAEKDLPMIVRVPIVPGVNDDEENIVQTATFVGGFPHLRYLELLSYHALGLSKQLESGNAQQAFEKPTKEKMLHLASVAAEHTKEIRIDGVRVEV